MYFLQWIWISMKKIIRICSKGSKWQIFSKSSHNGLIHNRPLMVIWIPVDQDLWPRPQWVNWAPSNCATFQAACKYLNTFSLNGNISISTEFPTEQVTSHYLNQLQQLDHLRSEIPPATPWLPNAILVIHIRSQVQTRKSQSYKF